MPLSLVPQPRSLRVVGPEAPLPLATLRATLLLPAPAERLIKAAGEMFASVSCQASPDGFYHLCTEAGREALPLPPACAEGYALRAAAERASLTSRGEAGLYYGLQTLRQLSENGPVPAAEIVDWPAFSLRSDYLDLRNIYPTYENLLGFIEEMSRYKLNTLVVEWEDKIPFEKLAKLRHPTQAFTRAQFDGLMQTARDHYIDVIPLQQSFGHLEYALKQPEYLRLREMPDTPGEMCPLREGAFELAEALIQDTAALHPDTPYLHLGCDEVWGLGGSQECKESGQTRERIAIDFINRLANAACRAGKIPIIWHDMIEKAPQEEINRLDRRLVVAIWLYSAEGVNRRAPALLSKLDRAGIRAIACSAIRSADGKNGQNYPVVENRLRDVDAWIDLCAQRQLSRMINTNWASTYALGNPYGLFETSRYTAFYAAERCWNPGADRGAFLARFLTVYHGVQSPVLYGGEEQRFDYYQAVPGFLPVIRRNRDTALLISLMLRYENTWAAAHIAFRGERFPDSEVEISCLKERAVRCYKELNEVEEALRGLLPRLLTQEMGDIYLESRLYPMRLFGRRLEEILGVGLLG